MKTLYAEKKYFCDFMFDDMGLKEYVNQAKAYDIYIWISLLKIILNIHSDFLFIYLIFLFKIYKLF